MFEGINFLYLLGFAVLAFALIVGLVYVMKKFKISSKQLTDGVDMGKTISIIIKITAKELNFASDEQVDKIADIVIDTLEYIKKLTNAITKEEKIQAGIQYIEENCTSFGIEMNEERMFVVTTLLGIGVNLLDSLEIK